MKGTGLPVIAFVGERSPILERSCHSTPSSAQRSNERDSRRGPLMGWPSLLAEEY